MQISQVLIASLGLAYNVQGLAISDVMQKRNDGNTTIEVADYEGNTITVLKSVYDASIARLVVNAQAIAEGVDNAITKRTTSTPYYPIGCYGDNQNYRSLKDDAIYADDMTLDKCQAYCSSKSSAYDIFGVEYGRECYCGSGLRNAAIDSSSCNMACPGDASKICGGSNELSVYTTNQKLAISTLATPNVYQVGCFQDFYGAPTNYRVFDGANYASDDMTMESCASFCLGRGYAFGGIEYGRECYCGSTLPTQTSDQCSMPCAGADYEWCGGPNALQVFKNRWAQDCSFGAAVAGRTCDPDAQIWLNPKGTAMGEADCKLACATNDLCQSVVFGLNQCRLYSVPTSVYNSADPTSPFGASDYTCV